MGSHWVLHLERQMVLQMDWHLDLHWVQQMDWHWE